MRKMTYFAVFEPMKTGFSVYFPDLLGCTSYGDTFEIAQKEAVDALSLHIYGMEKDGELIPNPSDKPSIDPETASGYVISPVTIFMDTLKSEFDELDNEEPILSSYYTTFTLENIQINQK